MRRRSCLSMTWHARNHVPTLIQPCKHLRVVDFHDASNESSDVLTLPVTLALICLNAGRSIRASRSGCQPCGCRYVVRGLWTVRYLAAIPRRVLLMEQQVGCAIARVRQSFRRLRIATSDKSRGFYNGYPLTVCCPTPIFKILMAAFVSLSRDKPQCGQS